MYLLRKTKLLTSISSPDSFESNKIAYIADGVYNKSWLQNGFNKLLPSVT